MNELYPLGSVVKLKNSGRLVMIAGYYPVRPETKQVFRYFGVTYPLGLTEQQGMLLLNDESIDCVEYVRFADGEVSAYLSRIYDLMEVKGLKDKLFDLPGQPAEKTAGASEIE